jgi:SAM-dependent methyltransferase
VKLGNLLRYGWGRAGKQRRRAAEALRRRERFDDAGRWTREEDGLARRRYESYAAYVAHQASKLEGVRRSLSESAEEDFAEFRRRFQGCAQLAEARSVLCLGARLGTEVRALHSLGHFAVGIDLNPGEDNPYVLRGDFHHLVLPDGCVDAVYTNCLDHVFDLAQVVREVRRVLRPSGIFLVDLVRGYDEGYTPGEFEATSWSDSQAFLDRIAAAGGLRLEGVRDLGPLRLETWRQAVFRRED